MTRVLDRLASALTGRYSVERELGAGGMATVYLAHDLRHDRDVAIKVLHPELGAAIGGERFLTEIRTTARLQHPHVLALLDSGDAEGLLYYVMPFVAGETLRERLTRERQLSIEDTLLITREVADALQYAHAHGVIHRDIKPENILLQSGHALVADFGIALAVQQAGGARLTQTGLSLGTPQYMSPEQAMGERTIDARSDIYSLGAVVYEMLTGAAPFTGATVQVIVARVLTEKPAPPSAVRDTVPATLEAAVLRALAKLPADRFASAAAFASAATAAGPAMPAPSRLRPPAVTEPARVAWIGVAAVASLIAGYLLGRSTGQKSAASTWSFGQATQVTWEPGLEITPALSPDGKLIAYAATDGTRSRIFVRPVAGGRPVPLTDDSAAVETQPQWSHDATRILYLKDGQVFSAPAGGGVSRQEIPSRGPPVESATWSSDERQIAYVIMDSLFVREPEGTSRHVANLFTPSLCTWGSRNLIACTAGNEFFMRLGMTFGNVAPSRITLVDPKSGVTRTVTDSISSNVAPRWAPDGRTLLYVSDRLGPWDIYALPIGDDGSASGPPRRLTVGLNVHTFSLSADGSRLAYAVMTQGSNVWSQPWSESASSTATMPTQVTFGQQIVESVKISRDGQWLYYDSNISGNADLYRLRLPGGQPERLTTDRTAEFAPNPSPDGRSVAFHSWRTGSRDVYIMPLDGGPVEQVTHSTDQESDPAWSPDGQVLSFMIQAAPGALHLARRNAKGTWETRKRVSGAYWIAWSPDGQKLSYATSISGGGLRVVAADSGAPRAPFDETAPNAPLAEVSSWSADGRTIYFKSHSANGDVSLWSVPAAGGQPQRLLSLGDGRLRSDRYGFAISDGRLYYTMFDRQSNVWVMDVGR